MKPTPPLFTLFCLFSITALAQSDFSEGLIVLRNGDSIPAMIQKISGRIAPKTIYYRSGSSELKSASAHEVRWFRFNGGNWYFGYTGPIETSSLNNEQLTYDSALQTKQDTFFVRAVLLSRASLFYARDQSDRIHLFISKNEGLISELIYKKFYFDEVLYKDPMHQVPFTKKTIMAKPLFKAQLAQAFDDCPNLIAALSTRSVSYTQNDLLLLFKEYNSCTGADVLFEETANKGKVELAVVAGVNSTGLKISGPGDEWEQASFDRDINFQAGIGINWLLPQLDERWAIYNEVSFRPYSIEGTVPDLAEADSYSVKASYVKLATMGRYQVTGKKLVPYIGIGMTNGVAVHHEESKNGNFEDAGMLFEEYRKYEQGFILGFGLRYIDLNTELRVEKSNGWSGYANLKTALTTWSLQFGYVF